MHTATVFLDAEKAFDHVWHDGLLFELRQMNIHIIIIQIIDSFFSERTLIVRIEDIH